MANISPAPPGKQNKTKIILSLSHKHHYPITVASILHPSGLVLYVLHRFAFFIQAYVPYLLT